MTEPLPKLAIPVGNPEVIGLLEKLLADARSGALTGVAVVSSGPNGSLNALTVGMNPAALHLGAGILAGQAMTMATSPQGRPGILRPVR